MKELKGNLENVTGGWLIRSAGGGGGSRRRFGTSAMKARNPRGAKRAACAGASGLVSLIPHRGIAAVGNTAVSYVCSK